MITARKVHIINTVTAAMHGYHVNDTSTQVTLFVIRLCLVQVFVHTVFF